MQNQGLKEYLRKYKEISKLNTGATADVYKVVNIEDQSFWAAKRIKLKHLDEKLKADFLRQVSILLKLKHKNVLNFRQSFLEIQNQRGKMIQKELIIILELCQFGDLQQFIKNTDQPLKPFCRKYIIYQVLDGLKYIHKEKIIHRDIKPQNIFISKDFGLRVADFGVSKSLAFTLERAKTYIGTPQFLSPEIIDGKPYSTKSDIWALGVTFYHLIYNRPLFKGKAFQVQQKILKQEPQYDQQHQEQNKVIRKMLSKREQDRPSAELLLKEPFFANINKISASSYIQMKVKNIVLSSRVKSVQNSGLLQSVNLQGSSVLVDSLILQSSMGQSMKQKQRCVQEQIQQRIEYLDQMAD